MRHVRPLRAESNHKERMSEPERACQEVFPAPLGALPPGDAGGTDAGEAAGVAGMLVTTACKRGLPNSASSNPSFTDTLVIVILYGSFTPATTVSCTCGMLSPCSVRKSLKYNWTLCMRPSSLRGSPSILISRKLEASIQRLRFVPSRAVSRNL